MRNHAWQELLLRAFRFSGKRRVVIEEPSPEAKRRKFLDECRSKLQFSTAALNAKDVPFEEQISLDADLTKVRATGGFLLLHYGQ